MESSWPTWESGGTRCRTRNSTYPRAGPTSPDPATGSLSGAGHAYQTRYAPFFGRRGLRGHARAYLHGLLSDEPRKSTKRIVLRQRGADAPTVRTSRGSCARRAGTVSPILAAHRELVAAMLGEDEGTLAVDGTESVGMARPYDGQQGKKTAKRRCSWPTWDAGRRLWWTGGCICPKPGFRSPAMRCDADRHPFRT